MLVITQESLFDASRRQMVGWNIVTKFAYFLKGKSWILMILVNLLRIKITIVLIGGSQPFKDCH